ncbi:hypothetical protein [Paenibacillus humicola]|uniref:hypothetical protein n=1 Tax=Paenibacillus humicola TaxID=3110540 RepID=UPI00237B43ED|nr:hypothetical protein [Paenibacillus humicola]
MWSAIIGVLPSGTILFCTILSFAVPFCVYRVNRKLHEDGDPPWKKHAARNRDDDFGGGERAKGDGQYGDKRQMSGESKNASTQATVTGTADGDGSAPLP